MRQFDVCLNPSERSRRIAPYVVILQSHLIAAMPTVVVAPMLLGDDRKPYTDVGAAVRFEGASFIVSAAELAAIDGRGLKVVGDLLEYEPEIRRAIEKVFTGF